MFGEWTTPVRNGRMTSRPPYLYVMLSKRSQPVFTTGDTEAYTHLVLKVWSFLPTLAIVSFLITVAMLCLASGALEFQAGRLATVTLLIFAFIPITISLTELSNWLTREPSSR